MVFTGELPAGGKRSVEPGGQLVLSSARHPDAVVDLRAVEADQVVLALRDAQCGLHLLTVGFNPCRSPSWSLRLPHSQALNAGFDWSGITGRAMMCSTTSLHLPSGQSRLRL